MHYNITLIYNYESEFSNIISLNKSVTSTTYGSYIEEEVSNNLLFDYKIYKDSIKLKKGNYPVNDYEVIINEIHSEEYKIGKYLDYKVNDKKLKVVGYYTSSNTDIDYYFVNNNTIKYNNIRNNDGFVIFAKDKDAALKKYSDLKLNIRDSYNYSKSNYIKEGFKPIIPQNTKLLSVSIDKDLVKLNFSKEFFNVKEDDEEKLISSIIYSITSIKDINKISIYIEGNILTKLPNSGKYIDPILDRTYGINHIYDFTSIKGTNKTTIYYLSKYNDYYYYVPVTIVNNENKDKIEIIIDELASKSVYQTGLISYLKDIQKMSYEQTEDTILINLNSEIFNRLNNNQIENIVYSINLSIKENYKVDKVIYNINNYYKTYSI